MYDASQVLSVICHLSISFKLVFECLPTLARQCDVVTEMIYLYDVNINDKWQRVRYFQNREM